MKSMTKKLLALLLCGIMVFSLAACNNNTTDEPDDTNQTEDGDTPDDGDTAKE